MNESSTQAIQDRIANLEQENGFRIQESLRLRKEMDYLLRWQSNQMGSNASDSLSGLFPFLRRADSAVGPILYANMDAVIGRSIQYYGEWCWNEILMVKALALEGDMIFDVGGNIGHHSRAFSSIVGPQGRVVAFEPNPFNACILQMNALLSPLENISVIAAGASDRRGTTSVARIDWRKESNYGEPALDTASGAPCAVFKLDDLSLDRPPSFIKIDVEGHEASVLRGAKQVISAALPTMMIEADDEHTIEICRTLFERNYDIYMYETHTYRRDNYRQNPVDIWGGLGYSRNVVCIPQERGIILNGLNLFDGREGFTGTPNRVDFAQIQIASR